VRRNCECKTHVHAGRVTFHRCVDELLNFGKGDNLIELATNLGLAHAEYRAV
jgi:hypothetical protein